MQSEQPTINNTHYQVRSILPLRRNGRAAIWIFTTRITLCGVFRRWGIGVEPILDACIDNKNNNAKLIYGLLIWKKSYVP
jgi:hypothetical protein